jgi:aspartate/methionine/tyrosine aminotransferase
MNIEVFKLERMQSTWENAVDYNLAFVPPRAGAITFVRYHLPLNSTELALKIIREKSVFLAPGDLFEMDHFLRIGFGVEEQALRAALARVEGILQSLKRSLK